MTFSIPFISPLLNLCLSVSLPLFFFHISLIFLSFSPSRDLSSSCFFSILISIAGFLLPSPILLYSTVTVSFLLFSNSFLPLLSVVSQPIFRRLSDLQSLNPSSCFFSHYLSFYPFLPLSYSLHFLSLFFNSSLKVHKTENFFGSEFEFCTISLSVLLKY
jgi:hypothetical protein